MEWRDYGKDLTEWTVDHSWTYTKLDLEFGQHSLQVSREIGCEIHITQNILRHIFFWTVKDSDDVCFSEPLEVIS